MERKYNKVFYIWIALFFVLSTSFTPVINAKTTNVLYQNINEKEIRSGVGYTLDRRLTEDGWLDTHVLKVDLTNPKIRLDVIESTNQYNIKEKTTDLITQNGAVAGINGDFFDMSKNPTGSLGMVVRNGKLVSTYNYINLSENKWTTFFIGKNKEAFIDFCKVRMGFYNEKGIGLELSGINKVTSFKKAVYIDRKAYTSTAEIDAKHKNLYKIVVEDDIVMHISKQGEVVEVPKEGYVIVMDEPTAVLKKDEFEIGQKVKFDIETSVDMNRIQMALGGAGKIVDRGLVPLSPGHLVAPNTRNPRTALGISKDKKTLYLVAVDGRSHSIGATHSEMTSLLLEYGVYDAIHLDGGGSTSIAARPMGKYETVLLNKPSDGSERKVVNGLGVFLDAPTGNLLGLKIIPQQDRVFKNTGVTMNIIGYDENLNPVSISADEIKWSTEKIQGKWSKNVFYPSTTGIGNITAQIGNIKSSVSIVSMEEPKELKANFSAIKIKPGESVNLWVVGLDSEGYKAPIDQNKIIWKVDPNLGKVTGEKLTAGNTVGQGILEGVYGEIKIYIPVAIGKKVIPIESFEKSLKIEATSYPSYVNREVTFDKTIKYHGEQSIKMDYSFKAKPNETQAAYINFKEPINLGKKPKAVGIWVYGDDSRDWLRAKVIDSKGQNHVINLASQINWTGWKYVQGEIPAAASFPVSLEQIYSVTLNTTIERKNTIYIDHISSIESNEVTIKDLPKSTKIKDKYEKTLSKTASNKYYDITVLGTGFLDKNNPLNDKIKKEVLNEMNKDSTFSIYAGNMDIKDPDILVPYMKWNNQYKVNDINNTRIIQISASKGGIRATNPEQWKYLQKDLDTSKDNIIIVMDKNPQASGNFKDSMEAELFHTVLRDFKKEKNKNIFVIAFQEVGTEVQIREGIRYFHLNSINYDDSSTGFSILRFRSNEEEIKYEIQSAYK